MVKRPNSKALHEKAGAALPDPRFVALARLLARHAARRDLQKSLSASPAAGYNEDHPTGERP
jgi:hypothetical protein